MKSKNASLCLGPRMLWRHDKRRQTLHCNCNLHDSSTRSHVKYATTIFPHDWPYWWITSRSLFGMHAFHYMHFIICISLYAFPYMHHPSFIQFKTLDRTSLAGSATLGDASWARLTTELIRWLRVSIGCIWSDIQTWVGTPHNWVTQIYIWSLVRIWSVKAEKEDFKHWGGRVVGWPAE